MPVPVLATKLYIPSPRPQVVHRARLIDRLQAGVQRAPSITLISAPAGFGKTTLVSEWISTLAPYPTPSGQPSRRFADTGGRGEIAWLSLDESDNDLAQFLTYLVAAFQTIAPKVGEATLGALQSSQPPTGVLLTALLNDLTPLGDVVLVLDDYHVIESPPINEALTFFVDHLPPQLRLVIATREDPQLPLARLRGRGQLTELRAADLRFTPSEAADFLNHSMGLGLSTDDIATLETRTEGWIAGLQLAALSMQGLQDTAGFIQSFTGSHRFVLDYLLEEVLHKQPDSIQAFLLQTSILERMCSPLCDAILLNSAIAGQEILEYLERANLFIVSLDNERRWYRYHHLFTELLRNRLTRVYPDQIAELHRRASDWYALNDFAAEAITHALIIKDWSRAADIIERYSDELPMRGETNTRLSWFESFPAQLRLDRPKLGVAYAWALFLSNQLDRAERQLNQLLPLVQTTPALLGELYVIRVMIAVRRYDMPAVIELAQQALERVPPEEASPRSRILLTLGVAYDETGGEIAAAESAFREAYELGMALPSASAVGNAPLPLTALTYLADYERLHGHLRDAASMYEQAIELADKWGGQASLALCFAQQGRAGLLYEWNDLDGVTRALQECMRIGDLWKSPRLLVPAYGLSALVLQTRGQPEEARAMLHRAEEITRDLYPSPPDLGALALYQISVWTAQNDFQAIAQWEQSHDSEWRSHIGRTRDLLTTVLARARIARYYRQRDDAALKQARALIGPTLEQTLANEMMLNATRLLILDAVALTAQGEAAAAIATLRRALALAEPENYVRSFLDIGKPMQELLAWSQESRSLNEPHLRAYAGKLLSQFGAELSIESSRPIGNTPVEPLVEPLTERELEVLRLIAQGLSNREISERLFLAISTIKGHTRIIFDKLQVQRRTEAVARARELGLL